MSGPPTKHHTFINRVFTVFEKYDKILFLDVKCSGIVSRQFFNVHIFFVKATDLSEASQEAVEEKLRATDRQ